MKTLLCILVLALMPALAGAAERPDWAFPVTDKVQPPDTDDGKPKTAPGSTKSYTRKQINDLMNPPDWYPDIHPPMPKVVSNGNGTTVRACAACHLTTGTGHDESAYVAGLPANYFIRQMADYKSGDRKGSGTMVGMAKAITDEEVRAAAEYFAALKARPWNRVVEADTVPKTYVAAGNKRLRHPDGGTEALGSRIIVIPEDEEIVLNRDPRSGFITYVPKGSVAKGKELAAGGNGKTIACTICHGPALKGLGDVPSIAGRQANYIVRQLWSVQNGERIGNSAALMVAVVDKLSNDDMLALGAYVASLEP